tara:strand:+ start:2077 stop:2811 length:735 start_codon:yes stop_codon:yes gene_type:complete
MNSIFLTGTAGSGKSQLTSRLTDSFIQNDKEVIAVNLDPGVNNLPYSADIDIRDFININEIMEKYNLGPNGAVILAADLIASKIDEINDTIQTYNPDYVFFDTPGQIELFAFRTSGPFFVQNIYGEGRANIFLCDSTLISKPENFVSIALLASSIKLQLKIPQICVLSKQDLINNKNLLKWAEDPTEIFNNLPKNGEMYDLTSRIASNLLESDLFDELIPVSSMNNQGIVEITALLSRILTRGD